jgi:hypothetical protein
MDPELFGDLVVGYATPAEAHGGGVDWREKLHRTIHVHRF